MPDLADRVTDDLYSKRLSIVTALETMPLGNKAELKRWRSLAWKMFDEIGIAQSLPAKEEKNPKKSERS